jgi:phosphoglycerate kinase
MTGIATLGDVETKGKTVLVRLDLNSPIDPGSNLILDDKRFREHLPTLESLKGSRVVIVTHQSRPGKKDFTPLQGHAEKLQELLGRPVQYVDDIFGTCARNAVRGMNIGDVLMLENIRFNAEENLTLKPEEAAKTLLVRRLALLGDLFVNDAFGTAHRSQPTMVGLPLSMRSVAGILMEKEVTHLSRVFSGAPRPVCFVLGGTKVDDSLDVARHVLGKGIADRLIVIGVVANVFLMGKGLSMGNPSIQLIEQLGYRELVEPARELMDQYPDRVIIPTTVAVRESNQRAEYPVDQIPQEAPVLDIGKETIAEMSRVLSESGTVVFNGPAGVFEDPAFSLGTQELLRAASKAPFSVVGGGHTVAVIERMGLEKSFTHISTGGGACIEFLTGKKLPALDALERSKQIFTL